MRFYYFILLVVALHLIGCDHNDNNDSSRFVDASSRDANSNDPNSGDTNSSDTRSAVDANAPPTSTTPRAATANATNGNSDGNSDGAANSAASNATASNTRVDTAQSAMSPIARSPGTSNASITPNTVEQVAETCNECHRAEPVEADNAAPYIAGQHANYLANAIQAYINGTRTDQDKKALFSSLTKPQINGIVTYYANQPRQWQRLAQAPRKTVAASNKSINSIKELASSCFACHGKNGNSLTDGVPSIAGLSADYLQKALGEYINGRRDNEFMKVFKHSLNPQKIHQLSDYFSSQQRKKTGLAIHGNINTGGSLANNHCAGCHGVEGNSAVATIPSLSGQNESYLVKAISTYRDGSRNNPMMKQALDNLSKQQIRHIASYYAVQKPAPISIKPQPSTKFDPVNDGKALAAACAGCHGDQGNSKRPGVPSLTRLTTDYLKIAINAYKNGDRKHALMHFFVNPLSDDDISKLALYYALQTPEMAVNANADNSNNHNSRNNSNSNSNNSDNNAEALADIIPSCAACHGDNGNSQSSPTPSLAGQDEDYLKMAITHYQSGQRQHDDMRKATAELAPASIDQLARYYASQAPTKPLTRIPEPPDVIAQRCDRCHGKDGEGLDIAVSANAEAAGAIPILAGQSPQYLLKSLQDYKSGARKHSAMRAMADVLSSLEMKAIATHYSHKPVK